MARLAREKAARNKAAADARKAAARNKVAPAEPPPGASPKRGPSRKGRVAVNCWIDPAKAKRLRIAAIELDTTAQAVMEQALDAWLAAHVRGTR